jgi:hypothetical protein
MLVNIWLGIAEMEIEFRGWVEMMSFERPGDT